MANNTRFRKSQASIDNIQRSAFKSLSHSHKTSFNVGDLVPILVQEVLPGDEFNLSTSIVGRLQTPLTPVMDDLFFEYFYFFVPNRLVWDDWKYFMGESKNAWYDNTLYQIPTVPLKGIKGVVEIERKSFADYLDIQPGEYQDIDLGVSVLPNRAYVKIWNEWFRDENLQDPILEFSGSTVNEEEASRMFEKDYGILKANKRHDYFTSALPGPQKGPNVHIPFGDVLIPVRTDDSVVWDAALGGPLKWLTEDQKLATEGNLGIDVEGNTQINDNPSFTGENVIPANLWADGSLGTFGAPTINALRLAFQIQKIYEKDARGGSRYVEIIRSHFGVVSPDARQQRPEYLGGGIETIGMQQQVATTAGSDGATEANRLGTVGAFSYTQHNKNNFNKAFTEHGYIIGLATLRYNHTYTQGIPKYLIRRDRFDFYDPTLAHLGEQPIYKYELYAADEQGYESEIFGYNEAWADYRYNKNRVSADMRVDENLLGKMWHYGDFYNDIPYLSAEWIKEDKSNVERTLALGSNIVDNFYCDIYFNIYAKRPMPLYSVPGLIDHF